MLSPGDTVTVVQSSASGDVFTLKAGDVLTVMSLEDDGNWALCRNKNGVTDHVAISNLQLAKIRRPSLPKSPLTPTQTSFPGDGSPTVLPSPKDDIDKTKCTQEDGAYDNDAMYFKIIQDASGGDLLSVCAGDIVQELQGRTYASFADRFYARNLRTLQSGWVMRSNVRTATSLHQKPWYFESLSRGQAENLLNDPSLADGTYLVRKSDNARGHVLTFKEGVSVRHRIIHESGDLFFAWAPHEFASIEELVAGHSDGRSCAKYLGPPYNKTPTTRRPAPSLPPPIARSQWTPGRESNA